MRTEVIWKSHSDVREVSPSEPKGKAENEKRRSPLFYSGTASEKPTQALPGCPGNLHIEFPLTSPQPATRDRAKDL